MTVKLTKTICIYNGADSDDPTAIIDRIAWASNSDSLKSNGMTETCSPRDLYTAFIVFNEERET